MAESRYFANRGRHLVVFVFYAGLSFVFIDHGVSLTDQLLGRGSDPYGFVWFLAWWPWAIIHHLNPFWTNLIWQPSGYALLWGSSVPVLAFLTAPLTLALGPVLSFNLTVLLAPVLSAWCAYRLCLRITSVPSAALAGGYIFGFSSYQMAQAAILNLSFTFLLPCLIWVLLARVLQDIGRLTAVALVSLILSSEFLISTEIFAMFVLFGGITWLAAFRILVAHRPVLLALLCDGLITALITAALISPLLVLMFSHYPFVHLPAFWPYFFSADLLGFALPSANTLIGGAVFHNVIHGFFGDMQERDSYLGLPLLLIIYLFAKNCWRQPAARLLVFVFVAFLILSLGPHLWVGGTYTNIVLPWFAFLHLPLLGGALPVRFALYASMAAAIAAALWIAGTGPGRTRNIRLLIAAGAGVAILPAPGPHEKLPDSTFFMPGRVQQVLGPSPKLLILPFGPSGPSSYWQVENRFGFIQTGGYLGFPPAAMQIYPAVQELFSGDATQLNLADFTAFVEATNTQYIVAGPGTSPGLFAALAQLHWKMQQTDDVTIYTVPGETEPPHG